ncbi:LIC12587 family lipoprotein [Leptospira alexanderi]|uniref:tetratricopeptide repeat protein n=1 Tax=Leptospira alexanderi TaxID=100053 RepID=UPI000990CCF3
MTFNTKIITLVVLSFLLSVCTSGQKSVDSDPSQESAIRSKIQGIDFQLSSSPLDEKKRSSLLMEKAKLLLQIEAYKEATIVLKEIQNSKEGKDVEHLDHYLGTAYLGINDTENAIVHFRKSESVDKNYESTIRKKMYAKALYQEEKYGLALGILGRASREKDFEKDILFYETVANSFMRIKEFKRCQMVLEEGLQKFPESPVLKEIQDQLSQVLPR